MQLIGNGFIHCHYHKSINFKTQITNINNTMQEYILIIFVHINQF